ncbi:MAG: secretin N-terminal domain-containing protein, partial [Pseudobdellovibrio sp.]
GYAIVKRDEFYTVKTVHYALRDSIQASTEVPAPKPQRLVTWMIVLKNVFVGDLVKDLKTAVSSDGEYTALRSTNQLFITDWSYNIQRIAEMIKQADQPMDPNTAKVLAAAVKQVKGEQPKTEEASKEAPAEETPKTKKSKKTKDSDN